VTHDQDAATALAAEWSEALRRTGQVIAPFDTDDERELFRTAGRKAGRLLERPVRTLVQGTSVLVVLDDWMDNPLQTQVEGIRARKAIDAAFAATDTETDSPAPPATRPLLKVVPPSSDDTV
jgi:hypothetical protein